MMNKSLFQTVSLLLSTVFLWGLIGCTKPEEPEPEPQPQPEFTIEQTQLEVPSSGGSFSVPYSLKNPVEGTQFTFDCQEAWISDIEVNTEKSLVQFQVAANEELEGRKASVSVAYGELKPQSFTVLQTAAKAPEELSFIVEFLETGVDFVKGMVTPSNSEGTYATLVIDKTACDMNFSTDQKLFSYILEDFNKSADAADLPLSDYLEQNILVKGEQTRHVKGLLSMKEYYFLVFGLSSEGELTTPILREAFETLEPEDQSVSFEMDFVIDGPQVTMSVVPSDPECYYYYGAYSVRELEASGKSIATLVQEDFDLEVMLGSIFGMSVQDIVHDMCAKGDSEKVLEDTKARTDYIGYALAIDEQSAKVNSEVSEKEFTTGTVPPSDNQLTLTVSEIGVTEATISVTATNNDQYVVYVSPAQDWTGKTDAEIFEEICAMDLLMNTHNGSDSWKEKNLVPGTDYVAFAFGYMTGMETTALYRAEFATVDGGNPEDLVFEFTVTDITQNKATVTVKGTPEAATFYWGTRPANVTAEQIKEELDADIQEYINNGWVKNRAEYMALVIDRGSDTFYYENLIAGTEYRPYAIGIYELTGEYATEVQFGQTFKTLDLPRCDLNISLIYDKYFNGDEVAEAYPRYDGGKGMAVLPVKTQVDEGAAEYLYQLFNDDLTDTSVYSDEVIIKNLESSGIRSKSERMFYCKWNRNQTLLAVAKDKDGKYGNVYRSVINLSKDGVSPISEFVAPEAQPSPMMAPEFQK